MVNKSYLIISTVFWCMTVYWLTAIKSISVQCLRSDLNRSLPCSGKWHRRVFNALTHPLALVFQVLSFLCCFEFPFCCAWNACWLTRASIGNLSANGNVLCFSIDDKLKDQCLLVSLCLAWWFLLTIRISLPVFPISLVFFSPLNWLCIQKNFLRVEPLTFEQIIASLC